MKKKAWERVRDEKRERVEVTGQKRATPLTSLGGGICNPAQLADCKCRQYYFCSFAQIHSPLPIFSPTARQIQSIGSGRFEGQACTHGCLSVPLSPPSTACWLSHFSPLFCSSSLAGSSPLSVCLTLIASWDFFWTLSFDDLLLLWGRTLKPFASGPNHMHMFTPGYSRVSLGRRESLSYQGRYPRVLEPEGERGERKEWRERKESEKRERKERGGEKREGVR